MKRLLGFCLSVAIAASVNDSLAQYGSDTFSGSSLSDSGKWSSVSSQNFGGGTVSGNLDFGINGGSLGNLALYGTLSVGTGGATQEVWAPWSTLLSAAASWNVTMQVQNLAATTSNVQAVSIGLRVFDTTYNPTGAANKALDLMLKHTHGSGETFSSNINAGSPTTASISSSGWLKLSYAGDTKIFTTSYSSDGGSYTNLATYDVSSSWDPGSHNIQFWAMGIGTTDSTASLSPMAGNTWIDNVSVTAIPEPSTHAAIFGTLVLVGAIYYRRRTVAV